jgi:hypothetical protein
VTERNKTEVRVTYFVKSLTKRSIVSRSSGKLGQLMSEMLAMRRRSKR